MTFSPPLGSGEMGLHFVSSFGLPSTRRIGQVQQRAVTVIKGLEHLAHEERLRRLGIFIPCGRDGLGGSYINVYLYLMVENKEDGARFFSLV